MSTSPRAYLDRQRDRAFELRRWDCSHFAVQWLAEHWPAAAKAAAEDLIELGYNDVEPGDEGGIAKVYARLGCRTAAELQARLITRHPALFADGRPGRPGDIAINGENLAFGIVDDDHWAVYLHERGGYIKHALREQDAAVRAL